MNQNRPPTCHQESQMSHCLHPEERKENKERGTVSTEVEHSPTKLYYTGLIPRLPDH